MRAVIIVRVSTDKQKQEGSFNDQLKDCTFYAQNQGWEVIAIKELIESGRYEVSGREQFQEVLSWCIDKRNRVDVVLVRDISRFSRDGGEAYIKFKELLESNGIRLQDSRGTIQDKVNVLERYGVKYDWSVFSRSEGQEVQMANEAKTEGRTILARLLGPEIGYTQEGFWSRRPPYGFKNQKEEFDDFGLRNILVEEPAESFFIKKLFQMKADGYSDTEIVAELNSLGYKSRALKRRDRVTRRVIGLVGGQPLTVKKLQAIYPRTIYAGYIKEAWTLHKPVKAKFPGLISVELFNKVNQGKVRIVESESQAIVLYAIDASALPNQRKRSKNNPDYPFKNVTLCPYCRRIPNGSASTGKYGKKHPAYHCSRGHTYWRVKKSDFLNTVYSFINNVEFEEGFLNLLELSLLEVWNERMVSAIEESKVAAQYVHELLSRQKSLRETIPTIQSLTLRRDYEREYEEIDAKLIEARETESKKTTVETNIKQRVKAGRYFMEHLPELIIDPENPQMQEEFFSLLFKRPPTYEELANGTPELVPMFKLKSVSTTDKNQLCDPTGSRTPLTRMRT